MKKLLMSLLVVSSSFVGLAHGAQQIVPASTEVPSLQFLCLKRLFAGKNKMKHKIINTLAETKTNFNKMSIGKYRNCQKFQVV